jgi:hypothetical protein
MANIQSLKSSTNNVQSNANPKSDIEDYFYLSGYCKTVINDKDFEKFPNQYMIVFYGQNVTDQVEEIHNNNVGGIIKNAMKEKKKYKQTKLPTSPKKKKKVLDISEEAPIVTTTRQTSNDKDIPELQLSDNELDIDYIFSKTKHLVDLRSSNNSINNDRVLIYDDSNLSSIGSEVTSDNESTSKPCLQTVLKDTMLANNDLYDAKDDEQDQPQTHTTTISINGNKKRKFVIDDSEDESKPIQKVVESNETIQTNNDPEDHEIESIQKVHDNNSFDYQVLIQNTNSRKKSCLIQKEEFIICGELCYEITSPLIKFLIKVKKSNKGNVSNHSLNQQQQQNGRKELLQLCEITHAILPQQRILTLKKLREEALKSGKFGKYIFREKKKSDKEKNDINIESDVDITSDEDSNTTKANNNNNNSKSNSEQNAAQLFFDKRQTSAYNRQISGTVNFLLKEFKLYCGREYNTPITPTNINHIKDPTLLNILKNVFCELQYFKTVSIFGRSIFNFLSMEDLKILNLSERDKDFINDKNFTPQLFLATFEKLAFKVKIIDQWLDHIINNNQDTFMVFENIKVVNDLIEEDNENLDNSNNNNNDDNAMFSKEFMIKKLTIIKKSTHIYHEFLHKKKTFGNTLHYLDPKCESEVISFFKENHSKYLCNTIHLMLINEGNQQKYALTEKTLNEQEKTIVDILCKLKEKITLVCIRNDDEKKENSRYGKSIVSFLRQNALKMTDLTAITCCHRRKDLLKKVIEQSYSFLSQSSSTPYTTSSLVNLPSSLLKRDIVNTFFISDPIKLIDIKKAILIDRSHLLTEQRFVAFFKKIVENNATMDKIQHIIICGNELLYPDGLGQMFRDMVKCKQFNTLKWDIDIEKINKNKVLTCLSSIQEFCIFMRNKSSSLKESKKMAVVTMNKKEVQVVYDELTKNGFRINKNDIKSVFNLNNLNKEDALLLDLIVIYACGESFSKYQLYKIFDMSTIHEKTIVIISNNFSFNNTLNTKFIRKYKHYKQTNLQSAIISKLSNNDLW